MKNFVKEGKSILYTNSGSAIASGDFVVIGDRVGCAVGDIPNGKSGTVELEGIYSAGKDADEALAVGDVLFYDASDKTMTKTAAGNTPAGICSEAAVEAATSCKIRLQDMPKRAAKVADASAGSAAEINALRDALIAAGLMKNA